MYGVIDGGYRLDDSIVTSSYLAECREMPQPSAMENPRTSPPDPRIRDHEVRELRVSKILEMKLMKLIN